MNLNYSLRDAEEWAAFSGDYNPIHFDLQHARKMGSEQLTVHGMRAMLDMKRHLSAALIADRSEQNDYAFSTRMRLPVLCQTPYHLLIAGNGDQVTGKLVNSTTQESCFSSKLTTTKPLTLMDCGREHALTMAEVIAFSRQFPGRASDITQTWSFFDALLFQQLVKSPETLATLTAALPELTAATLIDVFALLPVVQTHHETHFSAKLLSPDAHFYIEEQLHYAIRPMLVTGDKHNGFILRAEIQAKTEQQPLIMTAVTLKTWPMADDK